MRRALVGMFFIGITIVLAAPPSGAISGGTVDGSTHPNVAVITFYQPDGRFRCSATLVSPTVLVTAAHCTVGTLGKTLVSFAPVLPTRPRAVDDTGDGMSQIGFTTGNADWMTGTAHANPAYTGKLQLNSLHDVGVVVLDQPYGGAAPAALPPRSYLAHLQGPLSKTTFSLVGYGVFHDKPGSGPEKPAETNDGIRRSTTAVGQNLASDTLKLAENANDSRAGGGTCFGDSGGPVFQGGYLVADASFGASPFCRSPGGYQRLDTDDARAFLAPYVTLPA